MPPDANEGRGRWKAAKSTKRPTHGGKSKKWALIGILGTLLGAASFGALYLLFVFTGWFRPETRFVPFWVGRYDQARIAPVAWIDDDRRAIRESNLFTRLDESDFNDPNLEKMGLGFTALETLKSGEAVVVHVSGYAVVSDEDADKSGPIRILARDSNPSDPATLLPLRSVLANFADCPSRKKLLILDITKPRLDLADLGGMGTADGVADLIRGEVEQHRGTKKGEEGFILVSTGEGQNAVEIDSLGGSLFNHHFRAGLEDPLADENGDGEIRVKELAAYLARMVGRDAYHYRGLRQAPELLGKGQDFALISVGTKRPSKPIAVAEAVSPSKPQEPPKDAAKAKDETKEKPEAKEKSQPAPKEGASEDRQDPRSYPKWLVEGWGARETLWSDGEWADSPRAFRTLEAQLLRAERRWRGGDAPDKIEAETRKVLGDIKQRIQKDRENSKFVPRSVGQAKSLGWKPDEALVAELKATFRRRRTPDPFLTKPEQKAEALTAAVKAFLAKLKDKKSIDLAGAMVEALDSADERFDVESVTFADSIVDQAVKADPALHLDMIELRFLDSLARRAAVPGVEPWSEETARKAWDVVIAAEKADSSPRSILWIRKLLDEGDSLRHQAEILTRPEHAGFASWKTIAEVWDKARAAYDFALGSQTKINLAHATLAQARVVLPAAIPFLETLPQPAFEAIWLEASAKARELTGLLIPPSSDSTRQEIELINDNLVQATQALAELLDKLREPFAEESIQRLVRSCGDEATPPDPDLAVRIEAILNTSIPRAIQRQVLWDAIRLLDQRLGKTRDTAETAEDAGSRERNQSARIERLTARARRLSAFVSLAGNVRIAEDMEGALRRALATIEGRQADGGSKADHGAVAAMWTLLAKRCTNVRRELKQALDQGGQDDLSAVWFAPVDELNWRDHPIQEGTDRRFRAVVAWLASRYRHEKEDARDPETRTFYEQAEGETARSGEAPSEIYPELANDRPPESKGVGLSADHTREEFPFRIILRAPADAGTRKVTLKVLKPDDERLRVTLLGETVVDLKPHEPKNAVALVEWVEEGIRPAGLSSTPNGILIQAILENGLTYHLPVPLMIVPEGERLQLALSSANDRLAEIPFDLHLRALPGRQPFYVYIKNPSGATRNVLVEILEGGSVVPGTEAKPLAVAAKGVAKVPAFGAAPLPKTEALHALTEPAALQIRLKDAASAELLQNQKLAVNLALPDEYLEDAGAKFSPTQPGEPNRLEFKFRARPTMTAPAATLLMSLEKRRIPGMIGTPNELKLEGTLEPGGTTNLYAGGIALDPAEPALGLIPVDVDGLKRALWFQTHFEQAGGPQRAELINKPRVFFDALTVSKPGESMKLKVGFQVDDAPSNAILSWQLGQVGEDGKIRDDLRFRRPAKDRRIAFDARGADGALLFEASSKDWEPEFNVAGIQGERRLQAKLLASDGRTELASFTIDKILDDKAPTGIELVLPKEIKPKAVMPVAANLKPPASGLKEVVFYFGNQEEFKKAQTEGKLFKGKPKGGNAGAYEANLPIPETASGALVVSVRALSNVELAGFATDEVSIIAPKPAADPAEEAAAKAAMPKFGIITGKVTEGDRPQDELDVILYNLAPKADANAKGPVAVSSSKTDKKGNYTFKDVEPGSYAVYCRRDASMSEAVEKTLVKAGDTITLNLDLKR